MAADIILAVSWASAPRCMVEKNLAWESCVRYDMAGHKLLEQSSIMAMHGTRLDTLLVCELIIGVPAVLRRNKAGLKQLSYGSGLEWALAILNLLEVGSKAVSPLLSLVQ